MKGEQSKKIKICFIQKPRAAVITNSSHQIPPVSKKIFFFFGMELCELQHGFPAANAATKPCAQWISVTLRSQSGCAEHNRVCVPHSSIRIYLAIFHLEVWGRTA